MKERLIERLAQLVAVPSVNPEHGDDPAMCGEQKMADTLASLLRPLGFDITYQEVEPGRPNVFATYGAESPAFTLLFESHLDTVSVAGMTVDPFLLTEKEGRLYGRGSCDTKGPLAALVVALETMDLPALKDAGVRLIVMGAMGEETGNDGAVHAVEQGLDVDAVVVLEPTLNELVIAHKGVCWGEVTVTGRSGHGSAPEKGLNAIHAAFTAMKEMDAMISLEQQRPPHPLVGHPTLNIGTIHSGTAVNIIPGICTFGFDRRLIPGETAAGTAREYTQALDALKQQGLFCDVSLSVKKETDAFETAATAPLVRKMEAAAQTCGLTMPKVGAGWCSDASVFSKVCNQTVVWGPGGIAQAHTSDEFIEISMLYDGFRILRAFLSGLADSCGDGV